MKTLYRVMDYAGFVGLFDSLQKARQVAKEVNGEYYEVTLNEVIN